MIHLPYLSSARISGPDSGTFLQAQLTADIDALEPGLATFASYCTPRGQVLGLFLVNQLEDCYLVTASSELLPDLIGRLRVYVMRLKVSFDESTGLGVLGMRSGTSPASGYTIFTPLSTTLSYALGAVKPQSGDDFAPWKSQELENGVAWLDSHTSEKFIPQMLGHDQIGAVSFTKGCFPGQEIVARARYLGKVKRKPRIVTVNGQARITNGSRVQINYSTESVDGSLIDSAENGQGGTVLFIVTKTMDDQSPVSIGVEGASYKVM